MELEENKKEKYGQPPYFAQYPWLLICHGDDMQRQTYFSVSENRYYMKSIPKLKEKIIHAYVDEWFVLQNINSNDCYLWNLISNEKIELPPLSTKGDISRCLLSAPPHDPECLVIFLIENEKENTNEDENKNNNVDKNEDENTDEDENENSNGDSIDDEDEDEDEDVSSDEDEDEDEDVKLLTFYFCKPGYNTEFHKQDVQSIIGDSRLGIWTIFQKKIYTLIGMQYILTYLDVDNDSGRITTTPMTNESPIRLKSYYGYYKDYLIQSSSNNMLLYVQLMVGGRDFGMPCHLQVIRFDFTKERWMKAESIGEIAIFISLSMGTSTTCSTKGTNLKKDSINFTYDRHLYVYNWITHSISLSLPCPHVSKTKNNHMHWLTLNV